MYGSTICTTSDFFERGFGGGRVAATAGAAALGADAAAATPDAEATGADAAAVGDDAAAAGTTAAAADAVAAGADAAAAAEGAASAARATGVAATIATKITAARAFDGRAIPLPRSLRGIKQAAALTACCTCRSRDRPA